MKDQNYSITKKDKNSKNPYTKGK